MSISLLGGIIVQIGLFTIKYIQPRALEIKDTEYQFHTNESPLLTTVSVESRYFLRKNNRTIMNEECLLEFNRRMVGCDGVKEEIAACE
jgi:hypothetical protein